VPARRQTVKAPDKLEAATAQRDDVEALWPRPCSLRDSTARGQVLHAHQEVHAPPSNPDGVLNVQASQRRHQSESRRNRIRRRTFRRTRAGGNRGPVRNGNIPWRPNPGTWVDRCTIADFGAEQTKEPPPPGMQGGRRQAKEQSLCNFLRCAAHLVGKGRRGTHLERHARRLDDRVGQCCLRFHGLSLLSQRR